MYQRLVKYRLSNEQLVYHGFPRHHPTVKGMAVSASVFDKDLPWKELARICSRCSRDYTVDSTGKQVGDEKCAHHWGTLSGDKYRCCGRGINAPECTMGECHVTRNFKMNNTGFVETILTDKCPPDNDFGIYALDCEMVYTTRGSELARVTVVDRSLKKVYDTMVKPANPIIDYSTRFSGLTAEKMKDVTTTIGQVQTEMLTLINSRTILIGHSLDSDLKALKLIHDFVVDTSVLFPNVKHPEFKSPLRYLTSKFLKREIQKDKEGHDGAEDAIACMELILYRLKKDVHKR